MIEFWQFKFEMQFQKPKQFNTLPKKNPQIQPTSISKDEQEKQSFLAALAEVEELKQAVRFLEIQITTCKEKNEALSKELREATDENDVSQFSC